MSETRTVFTGANLLDGQNAARANVSVVVAGKRIESVSEGAPPSPRAGERRIDLGGKTLMPGMYSCHFHTGFGSYAPSGAQSPVLGLEAPPALMGMVAARNAQTALQCGFTGIIGSSNPDGLDVCLKEAMVLGHVQGPRMLACTREFMTSGEQADGTNRSWFMQLGNHGLIRRLDGADAFRQATREELGRGADIVKISVARGHGSDRSSDVCYLKPDELAAVVDTAHERGKKVRAHCPSRIGVIECARAGVDIIDHADAIDAEGIEAVLEADASICPSMLWSVRFLAFAESWDHSLQAFPIGEGFPERLEDTLARLRGVREEFEYTCGMLPELNKAGIRLCPGDDFGFPMMPHGDYISELEFYVKQLNISALDVLRWATKNGAEAMGRGADLGTIEAGKLADLLVVDGDPSSDISCLRDLTRLHAIVMDGEFVKDALAVA